MNRFYECNILVGLIPIVYEDALIILGLNAKNKRQTALRVTFSTRRYVLSEAMPQALQQFLMGNHCVGRVPKALRPCGSPTCRKCHRLVASAVETPKTELLYQVRQVRQEIRN
ncbi:hypothetical protein [Halotia branconii]|uniref:Uncharacterized protein n=1 Tax=Halotia branconii CENA392 TaxID=1539056 RepID=A0AAJ6NW24_9CYAN|nr:hypothetical protein [Halotia branconii]WGV27793.1 hypothetical protein QI031_10040 [Halotia branconii CENA392]